MCQLLALNALLPTDIVFSFEGFRLRGGLTDQHTDGIGIAFFEQTGCRLLIDTTPASTSPVSDWIRQNPICAENIVAHIRKATQGKIALENTHPFSRELWGKKWVFAHNGQLNALPDLPFGAGFTTVGQTDSELAFCHILCALAEQFATTPCEQDLFNALIPIVKKLACLGPFNFVLSFGEYLIVHGSTNLHYLHRAAPFSKSTLKDTALSIDFSEITFKNNRLNNKVMLIATQPLTENEPWVAFAQGELMLLKGGEIVFRELTCPSPAPAATHQALAV